MKKNIFLLAVAFLTLFGTAFSKGADTLKLASGKDSLVIISNNIDTNKHHQGYTITISDNGIRLKSKDEDSKHEDSIIAPKNVTVSWGMFDLGINAIDDRSNYSLPAAQAYLQVPQNQKNSNLFSLRQGKSINVNIWPVLVNFKLLHTKHQQISFYTGAGLQLFNYRFSKNITFKNEVNPLVVMDSVAFQKNKLAFSFVSVPLMLNFKTRLSDSKLWLTYGFGVIGGYCLNSWTKQISDERGKVKNHNGFNFNKFNFSLSAEIGLDNYIRFYATYQLNNMYQNTLEKHPFAIGIRFFGI